LVSLAYLSKETEFTDHVSKEAFIRALNDGPLQLEVMKGEPSNLERALNYATKYEAYEWSLVCQSTLSKSSAYSSISDEDRPKRRSRAVNTVQDTGNDTAPQLSVGELQDLLAQATKGIRDVPDFGSSSSRSGIRPLLANPAKFGSSQNFCRILPDLWQLSSLLVACDNSL